jgi:hypothetical protein
MRARPPSPKADHHLTHKAYNKLWPIAHGNGSRIVTKIYTEGQPILPKDKSDPETYIIYIIGFFAERHPRTTQLPAPEARATSN